MKDSKNEIGIITHYYNSTNYGGVLQSYALCRYLDNIGIPSRQICYDPTKRKCSRLQKVKHFVGKIYRGLISYAYPRTIKIVRTRCRAFIDFRDSIPHTDMVYNYKNIKDVDDCFIAYICGSDQVWNPTAINDAYSLSFTNKPKYSYAASIDREHLQDDVKEHFKKFLSDYKKISVREKTSQLILPCESQLVVDPVFLLNRNEWNMVASKRLVKEPYVFCYFLGDCNEPRITARQFAQQNSKKIVNIPYLLNKYRKCDDGFGDYILFDISPNDFLSLIKYADYVFTDSFHAICFSYIFEKQFYVFNRYENKRSSRITDILSLLRLEKRLIEKSMISDDVKIDYSLISPDFSSVLHFSKEYLNDIARDIQGYI